MFPVLVRFGPYTVLGLELGPFALHTYGLLVAAGFVAAIWIAARGARRDGIPVGPVLDLCFAIVLSAIVGSRLLYVLFNAREYLGAPLRILMIWEGGLVFHGGLLLAIPVSWLVIRRSRLPIWRTADLFAPAVPLGQAIGRLGCFTAGCCYGCETDAPWAVVFTHPETLAPRNVPLFPSQLLAAALGLAVAATVLLWRRRRPAPGQLFWLSLVLSSLARILEDALRGEGSALPFLSWMSATQAIAAAIAAASLLLYLAFGRRGSAAG